MVQSQLFFEFWWSTCTLTLQSTALRTLVLLMGWISISRVRHLDTGGGKERVREGRWGLKAQRRRAPAVTWVEKIRRAGVLRQADGWEQRTWWDVSDSQGDACCVHTHPAGSPPCWGSSYSHAPACQTCTGAGGERIDGSQNTRAHTHAHSQIRLYLVLLGVGVIFADPGGPRCPLSEEDPLMMPSKHVRDITRDFLAPRDPLLLLHFTAETIIFFCLGGEFRGLSVSLVERMEGIQVQRIHRIKTALPSQAVSNPPKPCRLWHSHH